MKVMPSQYHLLCVNAGLLKNGDLTFWKRIIQVYKYLRKGREVTLRVWWNLNNILFENSIFMVRKIVPRQRQTRVHSVNWNRVWSWMRDTHFIERPTSHITLDIKAVVKILTVWNLFVPSLRVRWQFRITFSSLRRISHRGAAGYYSVKKNTCVYLPEPVKYKVSAIFRETRPAPLRVGKLPSIKGASFFTGLPLKKGRRRQLGLREKKKRSAIS